MNKLKNLKINFKLLTILLISILIVLVILVSLLSPSNPTFIPFIPTQNTNYFDAPKDTLVQNSESGFFYNGDSIIISSDKKTATYFFYNQEPSEELKSQLLQELDVITIEVVDSSYKKIRENINSDPYLDGTFQKLPTQ